METPEQSVNYNRGNNIMETMQHFTIGLVRHK